MTLLNVRKSNRTGWLVGGRGGDVANRDGEILVCMVLPNTETLSFFVYINQYLCACYE